ncbi:MAG TPA: hypothetical protein VM450_14440 [Thermomicrobiales bacterium]|nr:hypothetical protein [Thermomicrobiales bacterium]
MLEFSRILTAAGLSIFGVGVTVYGIGAAFVDPDSSTMNLGLAMLIGGLVAAAVGVVLYRQTAED